MKYSQLKAFEKHLTSAAPHHLCKSYLLFIAEPQERAKAMQLLLRYAAAPEGSVLRMQAPLEHLRDLLDALQSPSLFGGEPVVLLDAAEKLGKKETETLIDFLESASLSATLILGAAGKTPLTKTVEKIGVVLDLSEEKPWDKEKRIGEGLAERVGAAGKRLSSDVIPLLIERLGLDVVLLDQEIDKLICFVGERPTIERSDVFRISAESKSHTIWQMAEDFVWGDGRLADPDSFHGLLGQIRSQLQTGMKIATLLEEGAPPDVWASHLPKMWPKTLEKRKEQAAKRGSHFFRRGLDLLFKVELMSRTGSNQTEALLDLLRTGLYAAR